MKTFVKECGLAEATLLVASVAVLVEVWEGLLGHISLLCDAFAKDVDDGDEVINGYGSSEIKRLKGGEKTRRLVSQNRAAI